MSYLFTAFTLPFKENQWIRLGELPSKSCPTSYGKDGSISIVSPIARVFLASIMNLLETMLETAKDVMVLPVPVCLISQPF